MGSGRIWPPIEVGGCACASWLSRTLAGAIDVQLGSCPIPNMSENVNPKSDIAVGRGDGGTGDKDEGSKQSIIYCMPHDPRLIMVSV